MLGQHSSDVLRDYGIARDRIDALLES
jgi:hypothetical protein